MRQSASWLKVVLVLVIATLVASPFAFAQSFRGSIEGTVTDNSGGVVPGAEVKVTGSDTGLVRSATTNDLGAYSVTELPGGKYSVAVTKSGYKSATLQGVQVTVGTSQRVDAKLGAGASTEVVTVNADVPLVESSSNTMGGTIEALHLQEIPINGRDYTKVLVMTPGATGDGGGGSDSPGSFGLFSSNGNRGRSNNYLLDGTDMNDGYRNLPVLNQGGVFGTPSTVLPVDALAEIPVLSNVEPEYGRNAGAVVNIVTKSGTKDWHGSVYEFFRNNALDARNFFNPVGSPQSPFHNNQFGGSLGGPIWKDKTFFFGSYEGQRESGAQPEAITVPSQAGIAAAGGASSPVIANLLALNPWGPLPLLGDDGATGNATLNTSVPFFNDANTYIAKIDQHIGQDLLTGRYLYGHSDQSFPFGLVGGGVTPGFNTTTPTTVNLVSLSYTHILTPKLLAEFRFGYNRFTESFHPQDNTFDPASIGLNTAVTAQDFGLPLISVSGLSILGSNAGNPRGRTDQNWQLNGNMTWIHGRHSWKWGYEFRRTTVDQFFNSGHRSTLAFSGLGPFLSGNVDKFSRQATGDTRRNTFENNNSLYVQDNWRILPRVTLNYGLRWDYFGVIGEQNDLFSLFDVTTATVNPAKQLYPKDYNNFAPRASVAWDIFGSGKTVARAGWGIYYDSFSQDFFAGQLPFPTFNAGPAFNGVGARPVLFSFSPAITTTGGPCAAGQIAVPNSGGRCADPVFTGFGATDVFTVAQKISTPFVHNFNVNVEQQLGRKASVQIGYVGSLGRKLFTFYDINQANSSPGAPSPFLPFIYILQFDSAATSNYHSIQSNLRIRDMHGLTSTVNYTYSHSIDDASDGQDYVPNATQPDNSFCRRCERANSNFDQRHHFVWSMNYRLPSAQSWKPLLGGWSVDNVVTLSAGQPVNVNYLFEDDFNGSGEFFGRPDLVGNPFASLPSGPGYFINAAAFKVPCDFAGGACTGNQHFGNLGRNALNGPTYKNWDFSLVKDTKLTEKVNMQLRADFFNILNHPNFASPLWPNFGVDFLQGGSPDPSGRGVGTIPSTATPDVGLGNPFLGGGGSRNIQFAVRFSF